VRRKSRFLLLPLLLLLLAGSRALGPLTAPTSPPELLEDGGYGYLELLPEKEYRLAMQGQREDPGFVPLGNGPSGLSEKGLFEMVMLLDRTVTLAVDGDAEQGYTLFVDLNADGRLDDDPAWPMKKRTLMLWDFTDNKEEPKEASVGEVSTTLRSEIGGALVEVPFKMSVAITEDSIRLPGRESLQRQALSSQSTLRRGTLPLPGGGLSFTLRGEGGVYNDDYNCLVFDKNGDGTMDTSSRNSSEYYWVWEKTVNLAGASYEFQVDRFGRSLILTPAGRKISDRPLLEPGCPAPDFAFRDLEGKKHRLRDYRGKVVLLDFWGTWCPACVAHATELAKAYKELQAKGLEILGVHAGGDVKEVQEFTSRYDMTWPQTLETGEDRQDRPLRTLYRVFGAPVYFLLDKKGQIVLVDAHQPSVLIREARALLAEP
jgi:peroxiredoxin